MDAARSRVVRANSSVIRQLPGLLLTGWIAGFVAPAAAVDNGHELLDQCANAVVVLEGRGGGLSADGAQAASYCLGYVRGVTKIVTISHMLKPGGQMFCPPPEGIATDRAVRILVSYLRQHPERLHASKVTLAAAAFMQAWPCPPGARP